MSANLPKEIPEHKGKCCTQAKTITKMGQPKMGSHLPARMKADDSKAVLMSDRTLGAGIRDRGH